MDDLIGEFLTETGEGIAELDAALVQLERTPDHAPTLALVFRLMHTIKGTCGFLGLPRLERVAHAAEEVLGQVRDGTLAADPALVGAVLAALDRIKLILAGLASVGHEPAGDDAAIVAALAAIAEGRPSAVVQAAAEPAPTEPTPGDPGAEAAPEPVAAAQTIRVAVEVLENLMTLVSELVLTRNQLMQLARTQDSHREGKIGGGGVFTTPLQRLSQITSDLQEGVMKTRMQPVGAAWNKLPRLVRDLGHDLNKRIDLVMTGAETELDRQVLELIRDPLTHMVRNSGDHGLEDAAGRRAAGKPEVGRITLTAFHEGGHIVIEIGDDGRGLDVARIRAKALAQGLATQAELDAMPEAQLHRFIFHPGFSTAATVTAVSGRGVGMDVVKTNIERIGGTIDLKSVAGEGSTFTIKIPLTLAIVSALIVEAAGQRFAIPQLSVVELVHASAAPAATAAADSHAPDPARERSVIEDLRGTPVLRLRERLLPLVSLEALLRLEPTAAAGMAAPANRHVVVAQVGAASLGIIVDRVFDTEEIVVKPVAPILRHITMFSGNTILGDGSVIMILDPVGIARATGMGAAPGAEARLRGRTDRAGAPGTSPPGADAMQAVRSDDKLAMLLFRAGGVLMAVPLGLIARLEEIARDRLERDAGDGSDHAYAAVTQYRGALMPLVPLAGVLDWERPRQSVLVFSDGAADGGARERRVGLVVDEIVDVVEETLRVELGGRRPGTLGTAVVAGRAAGVLDTRYWLTSVYKGWFEQPPPAAQRTPRVLVVEDSSFFRQLAAAGAGRRRLRGQRPRRGARRRCGCATAARCSRPSSRISRCRPWSGLDFVAALRAGGAWAASAGDRAVRPRGPARHRAGARGRVHRLHRQVRARAAAGQPAPMPEPCGAGARRGRGLISQGDAQMRTMAETGLPGDANAAEAVSVLVTLTVAGQLCAVPVMAVRDVLGEQAITPVPLAPPEIAGNLNLRGRIVTAIDLRRRLGLPCAAAGQRPMSVVAEQGSEYYALLVDEVGEVLTLETSLHEATPPTLPAALAAFADGVFRLPETLLMVLSVPRLLDIRAGE